MNWTHFYTAQSNGEALAIRSLLEAYDIPMKEAKETTGKLYGAQVEVLGTVELFVPEEKVEEAKQIIEEHMGDWTSIAFGSIASMATAARQAN